jgi:predicted cation transporter
MDIKEVIPRAFRVYIFIMALIFLGEGFRPLIDRYVVPRDSRILYWINMISAVLDNATLAAAELTPSMNRQQVSGCLMGLLLSGGMLIPGNIPNIITASRLQIASSEWARVGIPLGLGLMIFYYVILF